MSAVPTVFDDDQPPLPGEEGERLPKAAFAFYLLVGAAAIIAAGPFVAQISHERTGWIVFAILAVGAALAQLFVVVAPRRGGSSEGTLSYHTTAVFLLPAALLLAPPLAALIPIAQHVPEWLKKRQPWYIGTFNIFNYTLTILATLAVNRWVLGLDGLIGNTDLRIAARRARSPASSTSSSTTRCSRRCSASAAASRSRSPVSSRARRFPPSSCSRRSASPSRPSGTRIPG